MPRANDRRRFAPFRATDIGAAEGAGLPGFLFAGGDLDAFVANVMGQTRTR